MKSSSAPLIAVLALGVFGIITTEIGIVGVLPLVGERFGVSTADAGWLVSVFALVVAVSGPFTVLLTSGLNRKWVLMGSIAVFAVANFVYAYATDFGWMLTFRVIPAVVHPVFFAVALATAARMVSAQEAGKAATRIFAGVTVGFALGVPLTAYLGSQFSLEAAFLFGSIVNLGAFVGIWIWLPSMPAGRRTSYGSQLGVLRRPLLWLNLAFIVLIFAAMFSTYSYFADYLGQVAKMDGRWVSALLLVFGVVMVFGNSLFGVLLDRNLIRTVVAFPLVYVGAYALVFAVGSYQVPMVAAILIWGTVHSGGLIVSQRYVGLDTADAPEFGNSLFISFSNLGITAGAALGGWSISTVGIRQLPWTGAILAGLALAVMAVRLVLVRRARLNALVA
ncbi:arabinose ABC transporter permease [Arthrobacter alpinus]|uniref:MFS transporter n=1 Tax=Arthrobacter alpinus TaxID=656366 RepID=UPI0005CB320B|nr:MFS transporter [Arthrobacter alpinus]ALV45362.1 arabinose ABC transporter permease [Arthrobacter alpinus]